MKGLTFVSLLCHESSGVDDLSKDFVRRHRRREDELEDLLFTLLLLRLVVQFIHTGWLARFPSFDNCVLGLGKESARH